MLCEFDLLWLDLPTQLVVGTLNITSGKIRNAYIYLEHFEVKLWLMNLIKLSETLPHNTNTICLTACETTSNIRSMGCKAMWDWYPECIL